MMLIGIKDMMKKIRYRCYDSIKDFVERARDKDISKISFLIGTIAIISFFSLKIFSRLQTKKEFAYFLIVLCLLIVILYFFLSLLSKKENIKYEWVFFISVLLWGLVYSMVMPPFSGHDEQVHFGTAYYLSNIIIHKDFDMGQIGGRLEDALVTYGNGDDIFNISPSWYTVISNGNWFGISERDIGYINMPMWTVSKWWEYLPLSLGIIIARGLCLGHWGLIFFSRFFYTSFVAIIGAYAIRVSPYAKNQMCFVSMVAGFARLFSSFNYDSVIIVLEMLMLAISLKIYVEKKMTKADLIGLLLCIMYMVLHKVYLCILAFIPMCIVYKTIISSFDKKKKREVVIAGCIILLVPIAFSFATKYEFWISTFFGTNITSLYLGEETYTFGYIIHNLYDTKRLWTNTLVNRSSFVLGDYFGCDTAREMVIPLGISILLAITLVIDVFFCGKKGDKYLRRLGILVAVILLLVELLGAQLRFTQIGAEYISSFYARYTYPNMIVLMLMCGQTDLIDKENRIKKVYFLENVIHIIAICCLLSIIFGRDYFRYGEFLW